MKKILFMALVVLFVPVLAFGQAPRVNIHGMSSDYITQDSADTWPILIVAGDVDTSETFSLESFAYLTSIHKFNFLVTAHADSISMSIYLQTTLDDTTWAKVDSIAAAALSVAKLTEYSGADTSIVKSWTFGTAKTGRFILHGWPANAMTANGVNVRTKILKMR